MRLLGIARKKRRNGEKRLNRNIDFLFDVHSGHVVISQREIIILSGLYLFSDISRQIVDEKCQREREEKRERH